jgi:hypothetical protein
MKKTTDSPVRLMEISAPISPTLPSAQNSYNPYQNIGVGRPPPGRGKKPSSQRLRQEAHEVCALSPHSAVSLYAEGRGWTGGEEGRRVRRVHRLLSGIRSNIQPSRFTESVQA